jgi:glutathione S-transferase
MSKSGRYKMQAFRLLGYPVSNYVNIARAAMIEKGLDFDFALTSASQNEAFLAMNPMGKIPVLETPSGSLGETVAILEHLDDLFPERSLRPADLYQRALSRQIINIVQMYVEAPARSLFAGVFMGGTNTPEAVASARVTFDRSTFALSKLMVPKPFVAGAEISQADIFAYYNLDIADRLTQFVYDRSILDEIGGLAAWHALISGRDSTQTVMADFEQYFAVYLADRNAAYSAANTNSKWPAHA